MKKYILPLSIIPLALIVSVFLYADTTSAQEKIAPPTRIIGEVPTDYESSADLIWTGGTLYQLKARLQTLGCTADVIHIYNQDRDLWFTYSQYSWPRSFNQRFHNNYPDDYIPPSTIYIPNCYDMCRFNYTEEVIEGIKEKSVVEEIDSGTRCQDPETTASYLPGNIQCNQEWDPRVVEHVFPIMPVVKDLCIIRTEPFIGQLGTYIPMNGYFHDNNIWVSRNRPFITFHAHESYNDESLFIELHELCHSQQDWYVSQLMSPYDRYTEEKTGLWNNTPAGKALIDLANFYFIFDSDLDYGGLEKVKWELNFDSLYNSVYTLPGEMKIPDETAADLCAVKLFLDITEKERLNFYPRDYSRATIEEALPWLNEYIFVLE